MTAAQYAGIHDALLSVIILLVSILVTLVVANVINTFRR